MSTLILYAVLFAIVVFFVKEMENGNTGSADDAPYFAKPILTETEMKLFYNLKNALPDKVILTQVAMAAIIDIKRSSKRRRQFNRISGKFVDFVICDRYMKIERVIELDDWTHNRPDRVRSDAVKNAAFMKAGIPLIRYQAKAIPTIVELRRNLS